MTKHLIVVVGFLLTFSGAYGANDEKIITQISPETLKAELLKNPDKTIEVAIQCAEFWKQTYDSKNGGFFTEIGRDGKILDNNYKSSLSQSRIAYAFSRAYMLTGEREYLQYSNYAVEYLSTKCYDKTNGGFYTCVSEQGANLDFSDMFKSVNDKQKEKWSFMQHYALLGLSAYVDATRNEDVLRFLKKSRALLDEKLYDNRKGFEGYYESAAYDWKNPYGKGFTPTMDGITTHGLSLYLLTKEDAYKTRLMNLSDQTIKYIMPTMETRALGMEEHYSSEWKEDLNDFLFIGHELKTAWCLQRAYLVQPKPEYRTAAEKLMKQVYQKMYDKKNGGPFYIANSLKGKITSTDKIYWTLEQAINAGLIGYYITKDPLYLKIADETMVFYEKNTIDRKFGEVLDNVSSDGSVINPQKGSYWKSGYHSMETAYIVYLYGNLYLYGKPVTLYYWINKSSLPRKISLNPVEIEDTKLKISSVLLNDKNYDTFDPESRILFVPAGVEGKFKVTYSIK
jgi:cellobiose epimerase